jgi:L-alanine-DL-glutamate epimerase-like enolase superfamily enzyme
MVGCMAETRLGLSAAAHLVSARPIIRFADIDSHFDHTFDPVIGGMCIDRGQVHLPDAPGHGADLDPEFLSGRLVETFS